MLKFFILLSLLYFPASFAETGEDLINEHTALRDLKDPEIIFKFGNSLVDKTQRFISTPEGKKFASTPQGKKLLHKQKWLTNFTFLKQEMGGCLDGREKRKLGERIIQSAMAYDVNSDCNDNDLTQFKNGAGPLVELAKEMNKVDAYVFYSDVWMTSMRNTLMTKAAHELKYGMTKNTAEDRAKLVTNLIQEGCKQEYLDVCNQANEALLKKELTQYVEGIAPIISPQTPEQVALTINNKLGILNNKLDAIQIDSKAGFKMLFYDGDSADTDDIKQNKIYKDYQKSYMDFASKNEGLLLLSSTLIDKEGAMRSADESTMDKEKKDSSNFSKFKFKKHQLVKESDIKQAIKDVSNDVSTHIKDLKKAMLNPELYKDLGQIKTMVEYSPVAVAESLMQHPENFKFVCQSLTSIKSSDDTKAEFKRVAKWGGAIVGTGLVITGVGAGAGAAVLGTTFAGSAAAATTATTLATVATTSLTIGTGVGVAGAVISGKDAVDAYLNKENLRANAQTSNIDVEGFSEYSDALAEFKEARFEAGMNIGFAAMDLGLLKVVSGIGKAGVTTAKELKLTTEAMKKATSFLNSLKRSNSAKTIAEAFRPLVNGTKKMDEFLLRMSQSSEVLRLKFLAKLQEGKLTPEKLRLMAEESLEASKKCIR